MLCDGSIQRQLSRLSKTSSQSFSIPLKLGLPLCLLHSFTDSHSFPFLHLPLPPEPTAWELGLLFGSAQPHPCPVRPHQNKGALTLLKKAPGYLIIFSGKSYIQVSEYKISMASLPNEKTSLCAFFWWVGQTDRGEVKWAGVDYKDACQWPSVADTQWYLERILVLKFCPRLCRSLQ